MERLDGYIESRDYFFTTCAVFLIYSSCCHFDLKSVTYTYSVHFTLFFHKLKDNAGAMLCGQQIP